MTTLFSLLLTALFLLTFSSTSYARIKSAAFDFESGYDTTYHHVTKYRPVLDRVYVRRGYTFSIKVHLTSALSADESLTVLAVPLIPSLTFTEKETDPLTRVIHLTTSPKASVGEFIFTVAVVDKITGTQVDKKPMTQKAVILFNPYNVKDEVYYSNQQELIEYIDSEYGSHYRGGVSNYAKSRWSFAQFDKETVDVALYTLTRYVGDRSDPVELSRWLTEIINGGVIIGRWDGEYSDGTSPMVWTGSDEIFKQFLAHNHRPVKYTQCFNFGGVMTSLSRALGLPARQVFTFDSVHEYPDANGKFDQNLETRRDQTGRVYYNEDGSVWNFHSWTEVWINERRDGHGGGWQAVDATPQEKSEGKYRMGPASVKDVKAYVTNAPRQHEKYDVSFVKSEVDALVTDYEYTCTTPRSCVMRRKIGSYRGGALILASDVLISAKQDVTLTYKAAANWRPLRSVQDDDNHLTVDLIVTSTQFGKPIKGYFDIRSRSAGKVSVTGEVIGTDYRGVARDSLKSINLNGELSLLKDKEEDDEGYSYFVHIPVSISVEEYATKLAHGFLKWSSVVKMVDAPQSIKMKRQAIDEISAHLEKRICVHMPSINIEVTDLSSGKIIIDNKDNEIFFSYEKDREEKDLVKERPPLPSLASHAKYLVNVTYVNPLPTALKNFRVSIHTGQKGVKTGIISLSEKLIEPFAGWSKTFTFSSDVKGPHSIISALSSNELNAHGFLDFHSL